MIRKIFIIVVLLLMCFPKHALACSCEWLPIDEEVTRANAIFTAKVSKKTLANGTWGNEFIITKAWKGFALRSNIVWQPLIGVDTCDHSFTDGEEYLIFSDSATAQNEIQVSTCSLTSRLDDAGETLKSLGEPEIVFHDENEEINPAKIIKAQGRLEVKKPKLSTTPSAPKAQEKK